MPHPVQRPTPNATPASISIWELRRFLRSKQQREAANAEPGNNGLESGREAAIIREVAIVSVDEAIELDGVTVAGEKLHVAPVGNPEQDSKTLEANPFCGVTNSVVVPLSPPVRVSDAGERVTETDGVPGARSLMV